MFSLATFTSLALLALGPVARAVSVISPVTGDDWLSGTTTQTISWLPVRIDASSFTVVLSNQAGFLGSSTETILIANQSTGTADVTQSATVTYPGGAWPTGHSFRINIQTSPTDNGIMAQSGEFNITYSALTASAMTASISGSTPTTISSAMSSTASVVTITSASDTAAGGAASGVIIPSVSAKSGALSTVGLPSLLLSAVLGAVGLGHFIL